MHKFYRNDKAFHVYGGELALRQVKKFDDIKLYGRAERNYAKNKSQTKSILGDEQWASSSDLYPASSISSYWQNKKST